MEQNRHNDQVSDDGIELNCTMASLYIHIPFCEHKCIYCDFYSIAPTESRAGYDALIERFVSALKREVEMRAEQAEFRTSYETVFFGGGTPSLLPPSTIDEILTLLSRRFTIRPDAEITLETNPGTVNLETLRSFRAAGVNRISMGIQSFHDDDLRFLSRIHSSAQAKQCVRDAFKAGFDNVSFDLIFALPSQTRERWLSNLEQALALEPTHISSYSLIVEHNTPLHRMVQAKQVNLLSPDADAELYELTIETLTDGGFEQYEISNFAKPGFKSRHNSNYWNHRNYLGFGPSAHSFWTGRRWWNIANVVGYAERLEHGKDPDVGAEQLTLEQLREEEIFLGLRSEGVDVAGFRRRYDVDFISANRTVAEGLLGGGLAVFDSGRFRLTRKGYPLCDEICSAFV
jgi:oxygen-independent coproporphyrinogen-3 oxidase